MIIDESEAREIAARWGKASGSKALAQFAQTGLVADRRRLKAAIEGIRMFLKDTAEIDRLEQFIDHPCVWERAARRQGWCVADNRVRHVHDYEQRVSYPNWTECCLGEDIPTEE